MITIYKNKCDKSECGNSRGILLLFVAGYILAKILLKRLIKHITEKLMPETLCGFRGVSIGFFKNYLANCKQFVRLNGTKSSRKQISIGIPQGRISGPILFLLYIYYLPDITGNLNFTLFADDSTVTHSGEKLPLLTSELNN